jgi:hypothetical protein
MSKSCYYDKKGYAKGTDYLITHPVGAHADQFPPVNTNEKTSTDATIKQLLQLPVYQTLSAVQRYANRTPLELEDSPENNTNDKLCLTCTVGMGETLLYYLTLSLFLFRLH